MLLCLGTLNSLSHDLDDAECCVIISPQGRSRKTEMTWQLQLVDIDEMTLLMIASESGISAVFKAVAQEIPRAQVGNKA